MSNVFPIGSKDVRRKQDLTAFENAIAKARAIVDLLNSAALHDGALEFAGEQSVAASLLAVRDLLDEASAAIFPPTDDD